MGLTGLGPGPGVSPSLKAGPWAGPGRAGLTGLTGWALNQLTLKNINVMEISCKLTLMHMAKILQKETKVPGIMKM